MSSGLKVFVTGASGFIGEEVALGLRRAGYQVFGLVRSKEKGKNLMDNEVVPVVGDLANPDSYIEIARECSVIIHTAFDWQNYEALDEITVNTFLKLGSEKPKSKLLIYTSGILVYPHAPGKLQTEEDKTDPNFFYKIRPLMEQKVVQSKDVYGVVVRPAYVWGKKSRHFIDYFRQALEGKVVLKGDPETMWSEVHIDDLVDGYRKIVDVPRSVVDGQIFNFSDDSRNSNLTIAKAFCKVAGFTGQLEADLDFKTNFGIKSVIVDWRKAHRLLNWTPIHLPMLDQVPLLFATWKSQRGLQ